MKTAILTLALLLQLCTARAQMLPSGGVLSLSITAHGQETDTVKLAFQFACWDSPVSLLATPDLYMDIEYWYMGARLKYVRFDACSSLLTDLVPNPVTAHQYAAEWTINVPYRSWIAYHYPQPPPGSPPTKPPTLTVKYRYVGMGQTTSYYRGNVQATSTATPYPTGWITL